MPVPSAITDLSQTAGTNSPAGSESPTTADNYFRALSSFIALLRDGKGNATELDVASASTADIGGANSKHIRITGTTTITSFGTNYTGPRFVRFAGALTLTHHASNLILPSGANITTAAGDGALVVPIGTSGTGWQVLVYQRADGTALIGVDSTRADVASAATVDLTTNAPNTRHVNITGTTTITAFTVAIGRCYFVRFNAALTLTNNASIVTQSGANITTAAGDTCVLRATAANTVEVVCYARATPTTAATQAEMEAATSTTVFVTPGRAQNHPGVAKAQGYVVHDTGVYTPQTGYYGISSSITRLGTGNVRLTLSVAQSGTTYAVVGSGSAAGVTANCIARTTTTFDMQIRNSAGTDADLDFNFVVFGDQ